MIATMKTPPEGLGAFVAYQSHIGDAFAAADLARSIGCSWVAGRAGDHGAINDPAFLAAVADRGDPAKVRAAIEQQIAAFHASHLSYFVWMFSRPECWSAEIECYATLVDAGADGIIIDAEQAWAGERAAAEAFGAALRARLPYVWIADAPWPRIQLHGDYPEEAFASVVDARLIQSYWTEISAEPAASELRDDLAEWQRRYTAADRMAPKPPIWPIGVSYGRDELRALGAGSCPGEITIADVDDFLHLTSPAPRSLYSLEMLLAPTDGARALLEHLRSIAQVDGVPPTLREVR
jgi:hypothetical protein